MKKVIIVGTGISGLMSAVMLAQSGFHIIMLSYYESIRSASCMAQGGINAAKPRENDSVMKHFTETIIGGDWLADQQPVMDMCRFASDIITMYDRIGVAFNRYSDGTPDTRFFGGSKYKRTHYADTTTGAQLLNALDGQVRYYEEQGLIKRITGRDFVSALIDVNGQCIGCIVQNIYTMKLEAYTGVSLIIATGGYTGLYGRSTNAALSNGAAVGQLMMQGIAVANPEFVQFHPTAMACGDKPRLISESARGEGGRLWTMRDGKRWYFLEDMYPGEGNLVKRDLASQAIYKVVNEMKLGMDGRQQVYLDITHLPKDIMEQKLSNVIELYYKYCGEDPRKVPMKVYPAPHYSMGGIFVNSRHSTEINGLYACGECDYMYHGGNRLGGNSLLSATYSGYIAAKSISEDWECGKISKNYYKDDASWIHKLVSDHEKEMCGYMKRMGYESTANITEELGRALTDNAGIVRYNASLKSAIDKVNELMERWEKITPADKGSWANSSVISIRKLRSCLVLAQAILAGAYGRNESRGAHFKPEFPNRDNENWLKKTLAKYDERTGEIKLRYKPVDLAVLSPGDGVSTL